MKRETITILFLVLFTGNAQAFPQIPEYYQGTVTVDGSPASIGTEVKAVSASGDTFTTNTLDASGTYAFNVLIDDPDSASDEGASQGESLTWYVNGIAVSSPTGDTANSGGVNLGFSVTGSSTTTTVPTTTVPSGNASQALSEAQSNICDTLHNLYDLLIYIASGIGAVMIVVMGIAWVTSADNSRARTVAKEAVIHVIVGLIVVSLAVVLVNMVLPEGSDCIANWD